MFHYFRQKLVLGETLGAHWCSILYTMVHGIRAMENKSEKMTKVEI